MYPPFPLRKNLLKIGPNTVFVFFGNDTLQTLVRVAVVVVVVVLGTISTKHLISVIECIACPNLFVVYGPNKGFFCNK